jgi:signal transduction histidine kinase/ActR/RegA family two-component response regulator
VSISSVSIGSQSIRVSAQGTTTRFLCRELGRSSGRLHPVTEQSVERLRAAQVQVLYDQAPVALSATFAAAVILLAVFWSVTPHPRLFGWFGVYVLTTLGRFILLAAYRRAAPAKRYGPEWLKGAMLGIVASGFVWGAAIPLLPPTGSLIYGGLTALWVCGLAAGSTVALSAVRGAFFAFLLPAALPGAAYFLIQGTQESTMIGGGLVMFAAFLSLNALRMHRSLVESLSLQFENSDLLDGLAAEKQRIEALNAELERRVDERTTELRAANKAKSRFLAAAGHDLRQPLQTISLLQAALAMTLRGPGPRKIIEDMGEGLKATVAILDDLAEISSLDQGRIEPKITEFPLVEVLDELRKELAPCAHEKGLQLRFVASRTVVRSDRGLLVRILRNLLSNAIKYTSAGKILLGARRRASGMRIEVWDTGVGIPEADLGRVFEEFYQAGNPARERKGQGLGLAIVDRAARLLRHPLSTQSIVGKGSVFRLDVPYGSKARVTHRRRNARKPDTTGCHGNLHVLIVDDDRDVLEATRLVLTLRGFRVDCGRTGAEAIEHCSRAGNWPDIVIADFRLPGHETGVASIRRIRSCAQRLIPGLILTGDASAECRQLVDECGCLLLQKPVEPQELIDSILELTGRRTASSAADPA